MDKKQAFKDILNGKAIIITGSGAHLEVMTPNNEPFPSGVSLAEEIYKECGIGNPENPWDLQDATDTYTEMFSEDRLVQTIKKKLMVGNIEDEHRKLYSYNWQRVYTTNYDEVPRIATRTNVNTLIPVTLHTKRREEDLNNNLCIYINGYIGKLTIESLKNEFKLTGRSYLSAQELLKSEWGAVFTEDIETADCIIIVGLSLEYDLEIKKFIYNQNVVGKTMFIESMDISPDKKRKLERLGSVEAIGMKQFVHELEDFRECYTVPVQNANLYPYKSFDVYEYKKSLKKTSALGVYDLFMSGKVTDDLWYREKGRYVNIIYRKKLWDAVNFLNNGCKVLYIHANLGNGKTLFVESLKHQLQKYNYKVFTLKDYYQNITSKEIKNIIEETGKKLVVIENYFNYLSVIKNFALHDLNSIQFVFTARTVLYDIRLGEVDEAFGLNPGQSPVLDLNKLTLPEINDMNRILENNGLWSSYSAESPKTKRKFLKEKKGGNSQLQAILVGVLNSSKMKEKIEEIVDNIKNVSDIYYDALFFSLLIKTMSLNISGNDMSRILGVNVALDAKFVNNPGVKEILDFSSGETSYKLRSAVTANMILKELSSDDKIIELLVKTANYADNYRKIERYENILRNIISYSHVRTFLTNSSQKERFLINYYDALKGLEYYKENSFYWLQYAIACINVERYDLAQAYLDSARSLFRDTETMIPFQIDTQQATLYLILIEKGLSADIEKDFYNAHQLLMKPTVSIKDNPAKQIKVFGFYTKRSVSKKMLNVQYIGMYRECCAEAYNKVNQYLKNVRVESDRRPFQDLAQNLLTGSLSK
ncbi:MAG: hypothetical protein NC341_02195 [Blautia sp.]|nr:hypothetical protein [Blautia sp.]MCM1200428.1 hypothetical protein [Bacteroides fragilis]